MNLDGRVVLVTGGARRIGAAIALRLARAGCGIALHYHRSDAEARETVASCRAVGVNAHAFRADFCDAAATNALIPLVIEQFGRLDVLINNAATFDRMTLDDFEIEAWERTVRTNLTAPLSLAHAARDELRRRGGRIVNLCDAATQRSWPDHIAYVVSKAGLESLTRVLARALAPEVNVVGIAPGAAEWPDAYTQATRERLRSRIPLGRAGTAADIAAAVEFVLRDGDYITGAILPVDGGRHLA